MLKRGSSIIIFLVLLLILMSGVYASDDNQTYDALKTNSIDNNSIELSNDNLQMDSDDYNSYLTSNADKDLKIASEDYDGLKSRENDNLKYSNDENVLKEAENSSANWTELRNDFKNINGTTVNLTKDYYFVTVWLGPNTVESRVISFSKQTFTIDGHGHTLNFTSDRNTTTVGGRFDFYDCYNMTFKNIHFINAEIMNHRSNFTTYKNCTFYGIDMLIFQCSCNARLEDCTFYIPPEDYGRVAFGGKGWYDGVQDDMGGRNNVIINCTFENLKTSYSSGGALFFYGGNNTIINSTFKNCTISGTDDRYAWNMDGGGAISFGAGNNTIDGCNFTNCWTKYKGGSVYFTGDNNTISNSNFKIEGDLPDFTENIISQCGGIYFTNSNTNNIINSSFSNYHDCDSVIYSEGNLNVVNSSFTDNIAKIFDITDIVNISNSSFKNNHGIILHGTDSIISNSNFTNNSNENGGAIWLINGTIIKSNFINNTAENSGGAIYAEGICVINGSSFINNSAEKGGAIAFISTEKSHIYDSYFERNTAKEGSAIYFKDNEGEEKLENSTFVVLKEDCEIQILFNKSTQTLKVEFLPPDNYILGVKSIQSDIHRENLYYMIDDETFEVEYANIDSPVHNKNITVEFYDANNLLIKNITQSTDENGFAYFDSGIIFSDLIPCTYIKAYHSEDKYFKYAEDDDDFLIGDFDKLQYLVNQVGDNGVLNLTRNYTYIIGIDSITEGILINKNIIINGNGYSINALSQSRIFKILGNNTTLNNITFANANDSAIVYDNVEEAKIINSDFINNQGCDGSVYFIGENLTILNSQFINSTTMHEEYKDSFGDVAVYSGTSFLVVDSAINVKIENTDFIGSKFSDYGISITANNVVWNNTVFSDNLALSDSYYHRNRYYWNGRWYSEIKTKTSYSGFDGEDYYYNLVNIYADNVEISNIKSHNDSINNLFGINAIESNIKNIYANNTNIRTIISVSGGSIIDGLYVDNVTTVYSREYHDYINNKYEYMELTSSGCVINIKNGGVYTDAETGDEIIYIDHNNVTVKNINVKNNIESSYYRIIKGYTENLTVNNININNVEVNEINLKDYNGEINNYNRSARFRIIDELYVNNTNMSNISVSNVNCYEFNGIIISNYGAVSLKDIFMKSISMYEYYNLINIYSYESNEDISIDNLSVDNIVINDFDSSVESYYNTGVYVINIDSSNSNVTISDVVVQNSHISYALIGDFKNLKVDNYNFTDSVIVKNSDDSAFTVNVLDNLTFENILIDNIKIKPYICRNSNSFESYSRGNPGFSLQSQQGNINLYNVNLTNSQSGGEIELITILVYGNVTFKDVNIEHMSTVSNIEIYDDKKDTYTGKDSNSISIISTNGNVQLLNFDINDISTGIINSRGYYGYFMNITGVNITILDSMINNAAIGGFIDTETIILTANDYLLIDNFKFNNITPATTYDHTYYDENIWGEVHTTQLPCGFAGFSINAGDATINNMNITNSNGGLEKGYLNIVADNATLTNILIENINTSNPMLIYYNKDAGYIKETYKSLKVEDGEFIIDDYYYSSSPGISVESKNSFMDNIVIANCKQDSNLMEMDIISVYNNFNSTFSNIIIENITDKKTSQYYFDGEFNIQRRELISGEIMPHIILNSNEGIVKLYNLSVENVGTYGMNPFLEINGYNAIVENISLKNSDLGSMDSTINIEVEDLYLRNLIVDNISGTLMYNHTSFQDYFDRYGNYRFSNECYEAYTEGGFSVKLQSDNMDIANINLTNIKGGSYYGTLNLEGDNIQVDNVLIENISATIEYGEYFNEHYQKYMIENHTYGFGGLKINPDGARSKLILSNVKLNNIECYTEFVFDVKDNNISIENLTISNILYQPNFEYEYNENGNRYIYMIMEETPQIIRISGENITIVNLTADNIPAAEESFVIEGMNVIISKSTIKNIISEYENYQFNDETEELELINSNNLGSGLIILADNVEITDTVFDNITFGSSEIYGSALILEGFSSAKIINSKFMNIRAQTGYEYNMGENYTYLSAGSAIRFLEGYNVIINGSEFINCSADYGGALFLNEYVFGVGIFNSTFIGNNATFNGGAIYLFEPAETMIIINESTFIANHANHDGGAFFYNNTLEKVFFDDYQWFNRTAMFSDDLLTYMNINTKILNSKFENNTDYELKIITHDIEEGINQTVYIKIMDDADGEVLINITDENGEFVIKNKYYTLVNGSVTINIGILPKGNYNVSAYYNNYNSNYDEYHNYAYHINQTSFIVYGNDFNVTVNKTIYADENLTVIVKLNEHAIGTVDIKISNGSLNLTFNDIVLVNGSLIYNITGLESGKYDLTLTYKEYYGSVVKTNKTNFTVLQRSSQMNVKVEDNVYGNVTKIIVEVPVNQTGNVTVKINNQTYNKEVTSGIVTFYVQNLTAGEYEANVTFNENRVYIANNTLFKFNVSKANSMLLISNIGDDIIITVSDNASGNITVNVNGENYSGRIFEGKVILENVLNLGENIITADYKGDVNYNGSNNSTKFTIKGDSKPFNMTVTDLINSEKRVIINITGVFGNVISVMIDDNKTITQKIIDSNVIFNLTDLTQDIHVFTLIFPDASMEKIVIDGRSNGTGNIGTIKAEDMIRGYNSPYDYQATFLDKNGDALINTIVKFVVNGVEYSTRINESGIAQLSTSKLAVGKYNIISINPVTGETLTTKLEIVSRITNNHDMTMDYIDGSVFKVKVWGDDGNVAPEGEIVDITANGVHYVAKVDKKGYASLKINLLPKKYDISVEYKGFKTTNKLVVKQTLKVVKKITSVKKGKKIILKATLKWSNGKGIKGKKIIFKLNGKKYSAKTNSKGLVKVTIKKKATKKLKNGKKYTVKVTYAVKDKYGNSYQTISDNVKCYVKVK